MKENVQLCNPHHDVQNIMGTGLLSLPATMAGLGRQEKKAGREKLKMDLLV